MSFQQYHSGLLFAAAMLVSACTSPVADGTQAGATMRSASTVVFLARVQEPEAYMEALFVGRVVTDAYGCPRLGGADAATVIWPRGFTITDAEGGTNVLDSTGKRIGTLGGAFRLGGGEVDTPPAELMQSADRERATAVCPGKYWVATILQ